MGTVSQLLREKGYNIWSISPKTSTFEALKLMSTKNVGALLVKEKNQIVGIFSERDYVRKIILTDKSPKELPVSEFMSTNVLYISPETTVEECMALMTNKRVRHLPVLKDNKEIGIISIGDVVNKLISEQKFVIKELEKYISGRSYDLQ